MKIKKAILAMACAVSMMASMIPVSAAKAQLAPKAIGHVCVWVNPVDTPKNVTNVTTENHELTFYRTWSCQDYPTCKNTKTNKVVDTESHSWSGADDLGHQGKDDHAYRLKCGVCGTGKEIRILCEFNQTGRHNTP